MSTFRKALRQYAGPIIASAGEHKRAEIAQAFLDAHPDLAGDWLRELAERQVDSLIKDLCDDEPDEQISLVFDGLPAAIAVAPGIVKAIEFCDPDDIEIGKQSRADNIKDATARMRRYQQGANEYLTRRQRDELVGEAAKRLNGGTP